MKIIIQCANGKVKNKTKLANFQFVANPENVNQFKPDDKVPSKPETWRELITRYNKTVNSNPWNLLTAGKIYKNKIYKEVLNKYDEKDVFILSAGWGLIRSNFLIPHYDISFSNSAPKLNRRKPNDSYQDYNHLKAGYNGEEEVLFFGGGSYLDLFYQLTKDIANKNIKIYHATDNIEKHPEYSYIKYPRCFTNWHYQAVKDIL